MKCNDISKFNITFIFTRILHSALSTYRTSKGYALSSPFGLQCFAQSILSLGHSVDWSAGLRYAQLHSPTSIIPSLHPHAHFSQGEVCVPVVPHSSELPTHIPPGRATPFQGALPLALLRNAHPILWRIPSGLRGEEGVVGCRRFASLHLLTLLPPPEAFASVSRSSRPQLTPPSIPRPTALLATLVALYGLLIRGLRPLFRYAQFTPVVASLLPISSSEVLRTSTSRFGPVVQSVLILRTSFTPYHSWAGFALAGATLPSRSLWKSRFSSNSHFQGISLRLKVKTGELIWRNWKAKKGELHTHLLRKHTKNKESYKKVSYQLKNSRNLKKRWMKAENSKK